MFHFIYCLILFFWIASATPRNDGVLRVVSLRDFRKKIEAIQFFFIWIASLGSQ